LIESIEISASACRVLAEKCIAGIEADAARCRDYAERSLALITALAPAIGYDRAATAAKRVLSSHKSVREVLLEEKLVDPKEIDRVLDLEALARGGPKRR